MQIYQRGDLNEHTKPNNQTKETNCGLNHDADWQKRDSCIPDRRHRRHRHGQLDNHDIQGNRTDTGVKRRCQAADRISGTIYQECRTACCQSRNKGCHAADGSRR